MVPGRKLDIEPDTVLAEAEPLHRADKLEHLDEFFIFDAKFIEVLGCSFVKELYGFLAQLLEDGNCHMVVICVRKYRAEDLLARQGRYELILVIK